MAQSSLFFWGYEDEKEKLENPIITYFTTVCRCGCAERKNEMGAVPCGTALAADRKNQPNINKRKSTFWFIFDAKSTFWLILS